MNRRKLIAILAGTAAAIVAVPVTYIIRTENTQFRRNAELAAGFRSANRQSRVLVVYFSRSGNTELMALEIAKRFEAEVVRLEADDYSIGFLGWLNALTDSQNQQAVIRPEKIDLGRFDRIFIGSPIWWYSPSPPVWQFVASNDFTGKEVNLFNTFNSRFKDDYIRRFKAMVAERGGRFAKHLFVKRGRMTWQLTPDEMLDEARRQLDTL